jgi:hypothetical protein
MKLTLFLVFATAAALDADARKGLEVGQPAPPVVALAPSGDGLLPEQLRGKHVLLVFWSLRQQGGADHFDQLQEIRRTLAKDDRLLLLSVCADDMSADGNWEAWSRFLLEKGTVDYGDGQRRFIDDSKWWNYAQDAGVQVVSSRRYGVRTYPEAFLVAPDGKLLAVRIPVPKLRATLEAVLK